MKHISIGRQPILNIDSELCFYEVMYQGTEKILSKFSSASVINNVLNKFGTQALLGNRRAFVNIDENFLLHDIIFSIPSEFFIFTILESVSMSERVIERMEQLHERGFALAIDGFLLEDNNFMKYIPIMEQIEYIKIDSKSNNNVDAKEIVSIIKTNEIKVLAYNVETKSLFKKAKDLGCEFFEGYFFAESEILENEKYEPSQMAVLKLYNLLMVDTNIDEIAKEFEDNHEITVQLLQFINSGAFHFRDKISSIHHILTLVGRIPLGQWLMLMIYSKSVSKDGHSPLMLMVKNRTQLMEGILKILQPDAGSNFIGESYFIGVLSLMDTVFGIELEKLLDRMVISEEVKSALLRGEGVLGEIYHLVRDIENFKVGAVDAFESKHKLEKDSVGSFVLQSMEMLNEFESNF